MQVIRSGCDSRLVARLGETSPLEYTSGFAVAHGLPPFVRAASGLRRWHGVRTIVQDDVLALALLDEAGGIEPLLLPCGSDGVRVFDDRLGNKAGKPDLESALVLPDGRLVVFGSGASPPRDVLFVVTRDRSACRRSATDLYATLRSDTRFGAGILNIEGAMLHGEQLVLVQRGNAIRATGASSHSAMAWLPVAAFVAWLDSPTAPPPDVLQVQQLDVGEIEGVALGITDVAALPDGRIVLLACAENSASVLTDGPVLACRLGLLDGESLQTTDILDAGGQRCLLKLEGIEAHPAGGFEVVADIDDPARPAVMGRLHVSGLP